jgi:hypothetical protein
MEPSQADLGNAHNTVEGITWNTNQWFFYKKSWVTAKVSQEKMTQGILENEVQLGVGNLFSEMLCKCSSKDTTNLVEGFYENWNHNLYLKTFILNCQPIYMYFTI